MKSKKTKCLDCKRPFTAKEESQIRGPNCQKRHGITKVKKNKKEKSILFKNTIDANKKFKEAILSNKMDSLTLAEALVNPEYVSYLSALLGRDVKQEKSDTREYNNAFISKEDIQALGLMEGGVRDDVLPGEAMRIQGIAELGNTGNDWILNKMKDAIEKKDYVSFPFCKEVSSEIRTKYLLRTDNTDTYDSLMSEIESVKKDYISDLDWAVIKKSMTESTRRIQKEQIVFLSPLDEGITGKLRPLNKTELKTYNLNEGSVADFRTDSHDLVSLKELLNVMKGEPVDHLSPFAGAFSKYMPELNKNGVRGVVFQVEGENLKGITLVKYNGKMPIPFGPVEAGLSLVDSKKLKKDFPIGVDEKFYVCVNGAIAAPDVGNYSYVELFPKNNKAVPAAETFLIQSDDADGVISTRIYFYPYKPSQINPTYQNMSVIYGTSDQMFNSCANDPKGKFHSQDTNEAMSEKISSFGQYDEPAVKAAHHFYMPDHVSPASMAHFSEYKELSKDVSDSIIAENKFTVEKYLTVLADESHPKESVNEVKKLGLLKNSLPLTSRFVVYKYLTKSNGGLVKDAQITTFRKLKRFNFNEVLEDFKMGMKIVKGLKDALSDVENNGKNSVDAYNEHLDQETRDYIKNKADKAKKTE